MSRRAGIGALLAICITLALAIGALADFPDSNVASYAGCLNTGAGPPVRSARSRLVTHPRARVTPTRHSST
jgi:hypothetical protein